jgi:chromosome segregation ATPase
MKIQRVLIFLMLWIPAFAGMTPWDTFSGMTPWGEFSGMTSICAYANEESKKAQSVESFKGREAEYKETIEFLEKTIQFLQGKNDVFLKEQSELKEEVNRQSKIIEEQQVSHLNLQKELADIGDEKIKYKDKIKNLEQTVSILKKEVQMHKLALNRKSEELEQAGLQNDEYAKRVSNVEEMMQFLKLQQESVTNDKEALKIVEGKQAREIAVLEEKNQRLQEEFMQDEGVSQLLTKERIQYLNRIDELKEEIAKYKEIIEGGKLVDKDKIDEISSPSLSDGIHEEKQAMLGIQKVYAKDDLEANMKKFKKNCEKQEKAFLKCKRQVIKFVSFLQKKMREFKKFLQGK